MYYSHFSQESQKGELVRDHLSEVADLASIFSSDFKLGVENLAYAIGLLHDIGKYSDDFQSRLLKDGSRCDHSTAGAYELFRRDKSSLAFCIAGHHGGLPDGGVYQTATEDDSTLSGRMKRANAGEIPDYSSYSNEVNVEDLDLSESEVISKFDSYSKSFLIRMLFSCLVDADYLCTERYMRGKSRDALEADSLSILLEKLERHTAGFGEPRSELNQKRDSILKMCISAAANTPGVFSLTVPTGGGKTLASLRFAFEHATCDGHDMKRIIYALPYTSIIEQNASVFREILGANNVLEHHGNVDFYDNESEVDGDILRLTAENWDAPLIVTTNVQLFESLYSDKPSRCRRLHNLARSVIVLDEAQVLAASVLRPCIKALSELVLHYGCSILLCSATQPAFQDYFIEQGVSVREIIDDPIALGEQMRRVVYKQCGKLSDEDIADRLSIEHEALCIVNSRKEARNIFEILRNNIGEIGLYHLTTLMHPVHREQVISQIRTRLRNAERCIVIATNLIEAGVDLDFPTVYRAMAGIDNIVQSAGRCNREAKRALDKSIVWVFEPSTEYPISSEVTHKLNITKEVCLISQYASGSNESIWNEDFGSLSLINMYFTRLYGLSNDDLDKYEVIDRLSHSTGNKIQNIPYRDIGRCFRLISDTTASIIIPSIENEEILKELHFGIISRGALRRLVRYSVGLYNYDVRELLEKGTIRSICDDVYELLDTELYREDIGLDVKHAGGRATIF